jgi:acetylornithine deacetylase/succinyl-diaminopimelate desuccinylase-like protein
MKTLSAATLGLLLPAMLVSQKPTAQDQQEALRILVEMVETNTSLARGDVTPLAEKLAARFRKAGVPAADVQVIGPEEKNRNLVVRIRGTGQGKPVLFLAHLDVVDALRKDWTFEPYAVTGKNGWLYGRGTTDDKGPAATIVAAGLALARSGQKPPHDIIIALTSGEETTGEPGAQWLLREHRDLVDAEYVFNFDAGGPVVVNGKVAWIELQGAEKVYWTVTLTTHNPGGHSSLPRRDNAIYELADALRYLAVYQFPVHLTEISRAQLEARAKLVSKDEAALIKAAIATPGDQDALERLSRVSAFYNALLRTTCVATMLEAGHAENALPASATATVNCRLIPGETPAEVLPKLRQAIGDTAIEIKEIAPAKPSPPSPLLAERLDMIKRAARAGWGKETPISPVQESGATDGLYFRNAGIPVYGVTGIPMPVGEERAHGDDERVPSQSFAMGVAFARELMRAAGGIR